MNEKQIFDYILKIQAIAKIGLTYSKDPYAIDNYKEINELSKKFLEDFTDTKIDRPNYFEKDVYPTPNISVRTVIFNKDKTKILMVRESATHEYSLPGGWCDLYDSPSVAAKKECLQEAGAEVELVQLVAITDRTPFKRPGTIPEYVIVFEGKIKEMHEEHQYETDDVGFFELDHLPVISRKTSETELRRFIDAAKENRVIFD